ERNGRMLFKAVLAREDLQLAIIQIVQAGDELIVQLVLCELAARHGRGLIPKNLVQVWRMRVVPLQRGIQRNDFDPVMLEISELVIGNAQTPREFALRGKSAELCDEFILQLGDLAQALRTPDWHAHRTALIRDGAVDAL